MACDQHHTSPAWLRARPRPPLHSRSPQVSQASRSILGTSGPKESRGAGTCGQDNPRGHGDARGPREGRKRARGRSAEAPGRAPGLAPRPPVPALSSGRARASEPAGLTEERPVLPLGFCGQASPRRPRGVSAGVAPYPQPSRRCAWEKRGRDADEASADPARNRAARPQPGSNQETPRGRPGWACRAGLLQGRSRAAGRVGKRSRSLC